MSFKVNYIVYLASFIANVKINSIRNGLNTIFLTCVGFEIKKTKVEINKKIDVFFEKQFNIFLAFQSYPSPETTLRSKYCCQCNNLALANLESRNQHECFYLNCSNLCLLTNCRKICINNIFLIDFNCNTSF